jgi:hypothetical protein
MLASLRPKNANAQKKILDRLVSGTHHIGNDARF